MSDSTTPAGPPERHESIWLSTTPTTNYDPLDGGLSVDTAVVGGGIAGITTAAKLGAAGQSVAVLERDRILAAVTGHTTAKLTSLHSLPFKHVEQTFGEDAARHYAAANEAAIEDVEETVRDQDIDCEFTRRPACTFVTEQSQRRRIRQEVDVATRVGLDASFEESTELPISMAGAITVQNQASFHPRKYLLELAKGIPGENSYLFEETTVTDVSDGAPCEVVTDRGRIRAEDVVVATHFPVVDGAFYFSRLSPKRSYVLAATVENDTPQGMYYCPEEPYFSVRPLERENEADLVLFGGQNHRTGQADTAQRYRALEQTVRDYFEVKAIEYRWSTQDYVSPDGVPFIGDLAPHTNHIHVATGFGGWGMTGGTVAGMILRDSILGRDNEWADVYTPSRLNLGAAAPELVSHNTRAIRHLVSDKLSSETEFSGRELDPAEAGIFEIDGDPVGVYHDEDGQLHAVSAICTHMGCQVSWNDAEKSWDCACHGSRFDVDGSVLDTPAVENLEQIELGERAVPQEQPKHSQD